MVHYLLPPFAVVGQPLFGNVWLALFAVLGVVSVLVLGVAGLGRWLAATHPDGPEAAPAPVVSVKAAQATAPAVGEEGIPDEILVVLAAAVNALEGDGAQIKSIEPVKISVEALMQQWALEGRRQIYSSHRVR